MEIVFTRMFNIWYHLDLVFNLTSYSKELLDLKHKMHGFTGAVSDF